MATFGAQSKPRAATADKAEKATPKAEKVEAIQSASPFEPVKSEDAFKVTRSGKPIPDYVYSALKSEQAKTGLQAPVADEQAYSELKSQLNRAAAELGVGVRIRPTTWEEGTTHLRFAVKPRVVHSKRYSRDDVANWYKAQYGKDLPSGRIPAEIRAEFRKANGYNDK